VVLGCALPLFVSIRREMGSRRAFLMEKRIETRPLRFGDIVMQLGVVSMHVMGTLAVLTYIFTLFPDLDHLPHVLRNGQAPRGLY
jgi:hypothetical protein